MLLLIDVVDWDLSRNWAVVQPREALGRLRALVAAFGCIKRYLVTVLESSFIRDVMRHTSLRDTPIIKCVQLVCLVLVLAPIKYFQLSLVPVQSCFEQLYLPFRRKSNLLRASELTLLYQMLHILVENADEV